MTTKTVTFSIKEEAFFNNGNIILHSLGDFDSNFRNNLSQACDVNTKLRTTKNKASYEGIDARSLNTALRNCLSSIPNLHSETHVENGIFFHSSKEGFDFSMYDEEHNLSRLYNYYLGNIGVLNGESKILDLHKKMKLKKADWKAKIQDIKTSLPPNTNLHIEKKQLTITGELQFGNWALVYRDFFRLLNAANNPGVDFYIYITATGKLSDLLSDQTVSYNRTLDVINENLSLLKTPMWIIGLDIE